MSRTVFVLPLVLIVLIDGRGRRGRRRLGESVQVRALGTTNRRPRSSRGPFFFLFIKKPRKLAFRRSACLKKEKNNENVVMTESCPFVVVVGVVMGLFVNYGSCTIRSDHPFDCSSLFILFIHSELFSSTSSSFFHFVPNFSFPSLLCSS